MNLQVDFCRYGREVIDIECQALQRLLPRFDSTFNQVCQRILDARGHVIVIGMGKSGHVGRKIAATLASTGTPAFFIHPAEACHGDLGMISKDDIILAISYSGETEEILNILPLVQLLGIPFIALTGSPESQLKKAAHLWLDVSVDQEACPLGLAPTASTTATLAMGDALAVALLRARGFTANDFARFHPRGSLGRRLLMRVADLMHCGSDMPIVYADCSVVDALLEVTQKRLGMTTVVDPERHVLIGVFTDGDLRRMLDKGLDIHTTPISVAMTTSCNTVVSSILALEALNMMREKKITALPVVDEQGYPVGVLHMHDLLKAGM